MTSLLQDLRFAPSPIAQSFGFTIATILTLATTISANAVVFGVTNGLIFARPLDVADAKNLYGTEREGATGASRIPSRPVVEGELFSFLETRSLTGVVRDSA